MLLLQPMLYLTLICGDTVVGRETGMFTTPRTILTGTSGSGTNNFPESNGKGVSTKLTG